MSSHHPNPQPDDSRPTGEILREFARATSSLVKRLASVGPFVMPSYPFGSHSERILHHSSVSVRPGFSRRNGYGDDMLADLRVCAQRTSFERANIGFSGAGTGSVWKGGSDRPLPGWTRLAASTGGCSHSLPSRGMVNLEDFATSIWRPPDGGGAFVTNANAVGNPPHDAGRLIAAVGRSEVHIAWPSGGAAVLPSGEPVAVGHGAGVVEEWIRSIPPVTAASSDGLNLVAGHGDGTTSHLLLHRLPFAHGGIVDHSAGVDLVNGLCPSALFDLHIPSHAPAAVPKTPVIGIHPTARILLTLHSCGTAVLRIRPDMYATHHRPPHSRGDGVVATVHGVTGLDTSAPEHIVAAAADGTHIFSSSNPWDGHLHLPATSTVLLHPYSPSHGHLRGFHLVVDGRGAMRPLWLPTTAELLHPHHVFRVDDGRPVHLRRGGPAQAAADMAPEDGWSDFATLPILTAGAVPAAALSRAGVDPADPSRLSGLIPSRARAARGVTGLSRLITNAK